MHGRKVDTEIKKTRKILETESESSDSQLKVKKRKRRILETDSDTEEEMETNKPMIDTDTDDPDESMPKPVTRIIDRVKHFGCTLCDFAGKSAGVVHAHMVKDHGYKKMTCAYCKFSTGNTTSFHNHRKKYCRELKKPNTSGQESEMPKPVTRIIDGVKNFGCTLCKFEGKSAGVVHAHMVKDHGYKKMTCAYCKFTTANTTSFHNHGKKYCRQLKSEDKR